MTIGQLKQTLADLPDNIPVWLWHAYPNPSYNATTESKAASAGCLIDAKERENDFPMIIDPEDWGMKRRRNFSSTEGKCC